MKQHLLLRGSRHFASSADYAACVAKVCTGISLMHATKVAEEMACLRTLPRRVSP